MPKMKPAEKPATEKVIVPKPVEESVKVVTKKSMKKDADDVTEIRGSIYYEKSVTKNMGNFNSAKISCGITLPFDPTPEDVASANRTIRIADEILEKEIEDQVKKLS